MDSPPRLRLWGLGFEVNAGLEMRELRRSNDVVYLSFAEAALRSAGVATVILDEAQSVVDGSIGVVPRRLMTSDHQYEMALAVLAALEAELG